jgi:hypothetical protein
VAVCVTSRDAATLTCFGVAGPVVIVRAPRPWGSRLSAVGIDASRVEVCWALLAGLDPGWEALLKDIAAQSGHRTGAHIGLCAPAPVQDRRTGFRAVPGGAAAW